MYNNITTETLAKAYKPYDVVSESSGAVGFIKEVSVNDCQVDPRHQISYAVEWLTGKVNKVAWFDHAELQKHCNFFVKIAEVSCQDFGNNQKSVLQLFNNFNGK
jgi:hypothetical protein